MPALLHAISIWVLAFPRPLAFPDPKVNWAEQDKSVNVEVAGREELLNRCIESGLEVRYRFDLKFCRRRSIWFDKCKSTITEIHSMQFDPISESYKVATDRHGDNDAPISFSVSSAAEALTDASSLQKFPVAVLLKGRELPDNGDNYIGVRVVADCKGGLDSSLLDLSYFLTLGLVKVDRFDSGWIAFRLSK